VIGRKLTALRWCQIIIIFGSRAQMAGSGEQIAKNVGATIAKNRSIRCAGRNCAKQNLKEGPLARKTRGRPTEKEISLSAKISDFSISKTRSCLIRMEQNLLLLDPSATLPLPGKDTSVSRSPHSTESVNSVRGPFPIQYHHAERVRYTISPRRVSAPNEVLLDLPLDVVPCKLTAPFRIGCDSRTASLG